MQSRIQVSQASHNSLSQSSGGCGLSSTTTEADVATLCDASDSATVSTGEPGLSSRFTAAPVVAPGSVDRLVCLPFPPFSSNDKMEIPTSDFVENPHIPFIAENGCAGYTSASEDIKSQVRRILKDMVVAGWLDKLDAMKSHLKTIEDSRWDVRDNANFLVTPANQVDIYVRPCYQEVYSLLHGIWQGEKNHTLEGKNRCVLITGTPGIGKSVFGLVLLKMVMQRRKPALIFYQPFGSKSLQIFWQGEHYMAQESNAEKLIIQTFEKSHLCSSTSHNLDLIEIWSVADAHIPLQFDFINRLCITSPQQLIASGEIKKWKKDKRALTLAFPPCEWEELIQIRSTLYPETADEMCPLDKLKEQYEFWGGVPRNLIEAPDNLNEIHSRFHLLKIADVLPFLGTRSLNHSQYCEAFFHFFPAFKMMDTDQSDTEMSLMAKYGNPLYWWATEAMAKQAWLQFRLSQEEEVVQYIQTLSNDPRCRGKYWEEEIHHLVEVQGIHRPLRNLETGEVSEFYIQPSSAL
jgi:hypothetical protein